MTDFSEKDIHQSEFQQNNQIEIKKSKKKRSHKKKSYKKKRMHKWKWISFIVLFFFITLGVLFFTFIYTSLGIKLTKVALEKFVPEIKIAQVSGSLNDLKIDGFAMDLDNIQVNIEELSLSLSGSCLLDSKLCIKYLDSKDVFVDIKSDSSSPSLENSQINIDRKILKMPLTLELQNSNLSNINVNVNGMYFGFSSFTGKAHWINEKIYVQPTKVDGLKAIFPDEVTLNQKNNLSKENDSDEKKVKNDSNESIPKILTKLFDKPLLESLPDINIPIDIAIANLQGNDWLLHIAGKDYHFDHNRIQANTENNLIKIKKLETEVKNPYINGEISILGQIKLSSDWPVSATVHIKTEDVKNQLSTEIKGQVAGKIVGKLSTNIQATGYNQSNIEASVNLAQSYLPFDFKLNGAHIQWPINNKAYYQLNQFNIQGSGSIQAYSLDAQGHFLGKDLPTTQFDLKTNGTDKAIDIQKIQTKFSQGEFDLSGKIDLSSVLKWNAIVKFNQIDLTKDLPNYPILLDGNLKTNGIISQDNWFATLNDIQINGKVNDVKLFANGDISINSDESVDANKFNLKFGNNSININGSSKKNKLIANLNFNDFSTISQEFNGKVFGQLIMIGSFHDLTVNSNLTANNFVWQNITLKKAELNSNIKYNNLLSGKIHLLAHDLNLPNVSLNSVDLEFFGEESNHNLAIKINGKPLSSNISLNGSLNKNRTKWSGSLSDLTLVLSKENSWKLNKKISLEYDFPKNSLNISAYCLVNNNSKICLDNDVMLTNKGQISLTLSQLDLAKFNFIDENETKLSGTLDGKANINWDPKYKIPTIVANIKSNNIYVKQQIASKTLPVPFDLFTINISINDQLAKLDWHIGIKEHGRFNGDINIIDPINQKNLQGQLIINNLSLSMINPLFDENEHTNGAINSNLKFSGTLDDPYITGFLDIKQNEIRSSQLPADIQSMMLHVGFSGKSSNLNGDLKTKAGHVIIKGNAAWQNINKWNGYLNINGDEIEVTIPSLLTMSLHPNIKVEANQDQINLKGKIEIPKAKIKIESLPESATDVSSDEVILDSHLQKSEKQNFGMKINSKVFISLGDDVTVDAFGLTARLSGGMFVSQTEKGLMANGQINVPEGSFHSYGQDLIIRKGEIVFAGPIDQPRLNIEAIRNPDSIENNVTAGVIVSGTADAPKIEIFSEPAMSQQEALSYLLRGQGLDASDQSDSEMITALLIGLSASKSGKIVGDIGNTLGIKNLSLDTQGVGDSQKVVVSGYILPDLQLKYGIGIFDALATFSLRYRLLPSLYLEAASGLAQSVDVIYQFEF